MVGKVVRNGEEMVKKLVFGLKNWFLRKFSVGYCSPDGHCSSARAWLGHGSHGSHAARTLLAQLAQLAHGLDTGCRGNGSRPGGARANAVATWFARAKWIATKWCPGSSRWCPGNFGSRPSLSEELPMVSGESWSRLGFLGQNGSVTEECRWCPGNYGSRPGVSG